MAAGILNSVRARLDSDVPLDLSERVERAGGGKTYQFAKLRSTITIPTRRRKS